MEKKDIAGFGKGNGKVVHVVHENAHAACDTKRELLPEDNLKITDVNCKKCLRFSIVKELLPQQKLAKNSKQLSTKKKPQQKKIDKSNVKKKDEKKSLVEKKTSKQWSKLLIPQIKIINYDGWNRKDFDKSFNKEKILRKEFERRLFKCTLEGLPEDRTAIWKDKPGNKKPKRDPNKKTTPRSKKTITKEQANKKPKKTIKKPRYLDKKTGLWMIQHVSGTYIPEQFRTEERSDNTFRIIHLGLGGKILFDRLLPKIASDACTMMNATMPQWENIEKSWNARYVSLLRNCLVDAYHQNGFDEPKILKEKLEEEKVKQDLKTINKSIGKEEFKPKGTKTIRRRTPKEKSEKKKIVKIRRRKRPILLGSRQGTPAYDITEMLLDGIKRGEAVKQLIQNYDLNSTRANIKFTHTLRKLTRVMGIKVTCTMQGEDPKGNEDHFFIIKDEHNAKIIAKYRKE